MKVEKIEDGRKRPWERGDLCTTSPAADSLASPLLSLLSEIKLLSQ